MSADAPDPAVHPLRILAGARAAEAHLLDAIAPFVEQVRSDPARAQLPVRIAVPSRSLREHVSAALVDRFGAVAGICVRTLYSMALEIAQHTGARGPAHDPLFSIWIRQLAREEAPLRGGFEPFDDAYGLVEAGVADLLDAGFEAHHAEGVDELLAGQSAPKAQVERARALVSVAARVDRALPGAAFNHRARLFRIARESLERDPGAVLPGRAVFVHGFADATGVQVDFIESLVRLAGARVLIDHPPDPAAVDGSAEEAFPRRFGQRMAAAAGAVHTDTGSVSAAPVVVLHAPGPHAEARAVAERVRGALDAGVRAERIGVVARALAPYRVALRLHFGRLGIPFSAVGEWGPVGAGGRHLAALVTLLTRGDRSPAERWLDIRRFPGRADAASMAVARADLGLLLHELGAARLGDVAALDPPGDAAAFDLPVRGGLSDAGARHRQVRRPVLERALADARSLVERLSAWPDRAPLRDHRGRLLTLVTDDLGWSEDTPGHRALFETVLVPRAEIPDDFDLSRGEFCHWVQRAVESEGLVLLGGQGAGVQVLSVMEARARTFERLFVLGLARGAFPRSFTEDPLLPDGTRLLLRQLLPDLPVKSEARDEERYLFAQLISASPDVTLSCPVTDDEGKARPASPLVERLGTGSQAIEKIPSLFGFGALQAQDKGVPRPAHEHALLTGLYGSRDRFARVLPVALEEARRVLGGAAALAADALAVARVAVLAELDPPPHPRLKLGPYFGFAGEAIAGSRDLPYVTGLEGIAACPWQAFLRRVLRLDLLPDALYALPSIEPRVLGTLVHRVLERVVETAGSPPGRNLEDALAASAATVAWPDGETLDALLHEAARETLREEGITLPGFSRVLALRAGSRLELAREHDWSGGPLQVVGAEVHGAVEVHDSHGQARAIRFRADRVDRIEGDLRLTDYKTGRPGERQKTPSVRSENYCKRVASGEMLQVMAYALAGANHGTARGRYLYLHPKDAVELRDVEIHADQQEFRDAFSAALHRILEIWDRGAFFPRLVDAKGVEPIRCKRCEVKVACLRGDSGARRRLENWQEAGVAGAPETPAEAAIHGAWMLGSKS